MGDKDDRQKFFEEGSRLIDSLNRLMLFIALLLFYFLITPILYKIEKSSRTTSNQVESLNSEIKTLEQQIIERLKDAKSWDRTKSQITGRSIRFLESQSK